MSEELAINLYEQMINTENLVEAKIIKNIYYNQEFRNEMLTDFFEKKCAELDINERCKMMNKDEIGMVTNSEINILEMNSRIFPMITLSDKDNKCSTFFISIDTINKLNKQLQTTKFELQILNSRGIKNKL